VKKYHLSKYCFLALAFIFILTACSGMPIPDDKKSYIGHWQGVGMDLIITPDGGLNYKRVGSVTKTVSAPIKKFDGNNIVAGILFLTTTFEVQTPPYQDADVWKMVVDGVDLTRIR